MTAMNTPQPTDTPNQSNTKPGLANALWRATLMVGRWTATQSWWRLALFAGLLLVAEGIVTDAITDFHVPSRHHASGTASDKTSITAAPGGIDIRDDISNDHVHVGLDGIIVQSGKDSGKDAGKGTEAGQDRSAQPGDGAAGKPDAPTVTVAPVVPPDTETDDDLPRTRWQSLLAGLAKLLETAVMLLIVYAIAAKLLFRHTEKTEARANQAEALADREALERQLAQARLQALQAQVEPHFLFNTLASVDYLIESDPQRASQMQKHLIQYLRSALPQMRDGQSTLGREFDLSRAYLEILKMRMEERLTLQFEVPDGLRSADFPPMMLQSLVENAITHGLEPSAAGGQLTLKAQIVDGQLDVSVIDTGVGQAASEQTAGTGLGLTNIRERLQQMYGDRASVVLSNHQPTGTVATLRIPYALGKV
jgi:signal transduction histidine kinase